MSATISKALIWNITQAKGLQEVLKTNIGPTGTMKMFLFLLFAFFECFMI
jgi:chaperonin GroEL (HSP60 family)